VTPALQEAIDYKGAMVLEFICDPAEVILPMVPSGGGFEDMIVSHPQKKGGKITEEGEAA
jgi:acetolactate synthase-1/2/3 large subunit